MQTRASLSILVFFGLAALSACSGKRDNPFAPPPAAPPRPIKILGVDPEKFDCQAFLPVAEVATAVGSTVSWRDADMPSPDGVPAPCVYAAPIPEIPDAGPRSRIDAGPGPAPKVWQVALDCRPRAASDAIEIMDQLASEPGSTTPQLGKRALDHGDARLIILDDDTPCSIFVSGPDAGAREALGRATVARLDEASMPTRPHAVPVK
jgi:hypothetical protein